MLSNAHEVSNNSVVVVIPVKSFGEGKSRLAGALSDSERKALVVSMATAVVDAAGTLSTIIVTNDDEVRSWAEDLDIKVISPSESGLNNAADAGRRAARELGYDRVLICHADLPEAIDLTHVAGHGNEMVIVPDLAKEGSNVVSVPVSADFLFSYGEGSFKRHLDEAARCGYEVVVVEDPLLGRDLDDPQDLATFLHNGP